MNSGKKSEPDYSKPVAYDVDGRPLYAHPPTDNQARTVHISRPIEPEKPVINDAVMLKHERSKKIYPGLNLSEGEYVIRAIKRHPIGLFIPIVLGFSLIILSMIILFNYDNIAQSLQIDNISTGMYLIIIPVSLFMILAILMTYITCYVYESNRFFLTNESVIQEIQVSLFSKHEQTVSLSNIEDASYSQDNLINQVFNYGSIRLSTEGDETTYRFTYVSNPKEHIATLNNAVEAFKNGRPVIND